MPSQFVPARSSRHRTACFALYRALLRQVPQISLPDEIATGWGAVHPIKHFIRTGFQRNKADCSHRLVTAALRNGYRFLDLLAAAARSATGPEHASVLRFLEARLANYKKNLAVHGPPPPPPPRTTGPHPDYVPLLRRLPGPGRAYEAVARPRPLAELSGGVRRVPTLYRANDVPFLRVRKPQSPVLHRVLADKFERRQARVTAHQRLMENGLPEADEEEAWDRLMGELALREGVAWLEEEDATTYRDSTRLGFLYIRDKLEEEKDDMIARGMALQEIVDRERELAEKEEAERRARVP